MSAKKSDWLYKFHGKIAVHTSVARVTACEEPARKWDRRQKIGISQSNPLNRALIQNRPKQVKIQISRKVQGFLKIFRVQYGALTGRRSKPPCLEWCNTIFLYETFSRPVPRDFN